VGLGRRLEHYPARCRAANSSASRSPARPHRPDILLADEPTGNLDGANGEAIMDPPDGPARPPRRDAGPGDPRAELADRCDREVRLRDGRVEGTPLREAAE
jgi:putative ABC transport system ATP-binding protein